MDIEAANNLAIAVVHRAIEDWRYLCAGGAETRNCNFKELELFFENNCNGFLDGTSIPADRIYNLLKREKKVAELRKQKC